MKPPLIYFTLLVVGIAINETADHFSRRKAEAEYAELEQGCKDLMQLVEEYQFYADKMIRYGIVKSPVLLNKLEAGGTYEITPDSSTRRYWLVVEPDTTEISNPK